MVIVDRKIGHSGGSLTITLPKWFVKIHELKPKDSIDVHYNMDNSLTITPKEDNYNDKDATKIEELT
jgi:phosphate uptake regulator